MNSIGTLLSYSLKIKKVFISDFTSTAIAVYLIVTSTIYNVKLRMLWNPQGLMKVADTLFHIVIPILYLVYWYLCKSRIELKWEDSFKVLIFPFLYVVFIMFHGAITKFYPYPFLNIESLGYLMVLMNCFILTLIFFAISLLLIGISKLRRKEP